MSRSVAIVYKDDDQAACLAKTAVELLKAEGFETWEERSGRRRAEPPYGFAPELIISLGGDGTLLYAARVWGLNGAPLFGVNLGRLGFLAETEPDDFAFFLRDVLAGAATVEQRMALEVSVMRDERVTAGAVGLNEAVVNKGSPARIICLNVLARNFGEWRFRADGLIIATPTGSTGYNMSAGGPVVYPTLPAIIVTPICPVALSSRPLVLPPDCSVEMVVDSHDTDIHLTVDGQVDLILRPGDRVVVRRHRVAINLIVNPRRNFIDVLHHKLGWT
ncbi:MAG: NAD(+)/NADH kinase [Candidatus Adiutrix sp.]|nr:NAD(+)/NADH kinase [Candidatus Adiutrix sp.]